MTTYPKTDDYDLEEELTQLGTGEAMVTILSERGAPTPVVWTRLRPPISLMAAVDPDEVDRRPGGPRWATYAEEVDRDSARERLAARLAAASAPAPDTPADRTDAAPAPAPRKAPAPKAERRPSEHPPARPKDDSNAVSDYLRSREGRSMVNSVVRGVFGLLKKKH